MDALAGPRIVAAPVRRHRAPLSAAERAAALLAAAAVAALAGHGFSTSSPSTVGYLSSVGVVALALAGMRRDPLPPLLALALAVLVAGHLAGGLLTVGDDVLYNAHPALHVFQYDHVFHATASGVGVLVLHHLLSRRLGDAGGILVGIAVLGGLGLGAVNELVEFVATLAHDGSHVGGYLNTGWDLVADMTGTAVAAVGLLRLQRRSS